MHQPLPIAHKVIVVVVDSQIVHRLRMVNQRYRLHLAIAAVGIEDRLTEGQIACRDPALVLRVEGMVRRRMQRFAINSLKCALFS